MTEIEMEAKLKENENLVHYIINLYFPVKAGDEDTFQCGMIGLWKALESYDPNLGYTFSTYASRYIINSISDDWGRSNKKESKKQTVSQNAMLTDLRDTYRFESKSLDKIIFQKALSTLSERNRETILLYASGYTENELANYFGITHQAASLRINKARDQLRKYYTNHGVNIDEYCQKTIRNCTV